MWSINVQCGNSSLQDKHIEVMTVFMALTMHLLRVEHCRRLRCWLLNYFADENAHLWFSLYLDSWLLFSFLPDEGGICCSWSFQQLNRTWTFCLTLFTVIHAFSTGNASGLQAGQSSAHTLRLWSHAAGSGWEWGLIYQNAVRETTPAWWTQMFS